MTGGSYSLTGGFWSLISVVQTAGVPNLIIVPNGPNSVTNPLAEYGQLHLAANNNLAAIKLGDERLCHHQRLWHQLLHHHAAHGKFILPVVKIELFQFCRARPQSSLIYRAAAMLRSFVLTMGGSAPAGAGVVVESAGRRRTKSNLRAAMPASAHTIPR